MTETRPDQASEAFAGRQPVSQWQAEQTANEINGFWLKVALRANLPLTPPARVRHMRRTTGHNCCVVEVSLPVHGLPVEAAAMVPRELRRLHQAVLEEMR